jgi:hypothetical protein
VLELRLEGTSDEVRARPFECVPDHGINPCGVCAVGWSLWFQDALQALYKQVGILLPYVRALHALRLRAVQTATAAVGVLVRQMKTRTKVRRVRESGRRWERKGE